MNDRRPKRRRGLALVVAVLGGMLGGGAASAGVLEDVPPGHWAAISLNTIDSIDPCPQGGCSYSATEGVSAVIDDWNGGAFATGYGTRGALIVWGGGHNGYFGNEIYAFNLDTQRWERVTNPVANPVCNQTTGELQDGSPCAAHTYDYVEYHPPTNSFYELGSASNHNIGGGGAGYAHSFSFTTKQWARGGLYSSFGGGTGASSAYDPNRKVFWYQPAYNKEFAKYDPATGSWTKYNVFNIDIDAVSAIDPTRDLFVTVDGRGTHKVFVHNLANPTAPVVAVTTSGDTTIQNTSQAGFEWDPVAKKFVAWAGGTSVYTLTPPAGDWATGTWVWSKVSPAADNTVTPDAPNMNGTYSRWRYAPAVNAFVVANRTSGKVYLYKLTAGTGTTTTPTAPTVPAAPTIRVD